MTATATFARLHRIGSTDEHRAVTVVGSLGFLAAVMMGRFGLPPVDLHGPLHHLGIMDPLCGGTRAAYYTIRGQGRQAWRYNPLGLIAVVAASAAVARGIGGLLTGRWINLVTAWPARQRRVVVVVVLILAVVLEVRQQSIAPLLMAP